MPVLASIYAALLALIAVASVHANIKSKEPVWYTALAFVADTIALGLFVGYWRNPFDQTFARYSAVAFLFSVLWFLGWIPHHLTAFEERDFSPEMNRLYKRFVLTLGLVVTLPAYWFGGIAVFRSL